MKGKKEDNGGGKKERKKENLFSSSCCNLNLLGTAPSYLLTIFAI